MWIVARPVAVRSSLTRASSGDKGNDVPYWTGAAVLTVAVVQAGGEVSCGARRKKGR